MTHQAHAERTPLLPGGPRRALPCPAEAPRRERRGLEHEFSAFLELNIATFIVCRFCENFSLRRKGSGQRAVFWQDPDDVELQQLPVEKNTRRLRVGPFAATRVLWRVRGALA